MTLATRRAVATHVGRIADLLTELGYPRSYSDVRKALNEPDHCLVVADEGGDVVGVAVLTTRWQVHHGAVIASLDALVVDEAGRSSGIGAALLQEAVDEAKRGARRPRFGSAAAPVELGEQRPDRGNRRFGEHLSDHQAAVLIERLSVAELAQQLARP